MNCFSDKKYNNNKGNNYFGNFLVKECKRDIKTQSIIYTIIYFSLILIIILLYLVSSFKIIIEVVDSIIYNKDLLSFNNLEIIEYNKIEDIFLNKDSNQTFVIGSNLSLVESYRYISKNKECVQSLSNELICKNINDHINCYYDCIIENKINKYNNITFITTADCFLNCMILFNIIIL
jgi:hypothetical protein